MIIFSQFTVQVNKLRSYRFRPVVWAGIPTDSTIMRRLTQDTRDVALNEFLFNSGLKPVNTQPMLYYDLRNNLTCFKYPLVRVTLLQCAYDEHWYVAPWRVWSAQLELPTTQCSTIRRNIDFTEMSITDATELEGAW